MDDEQLRAWAAGQGEAGAAVLRVMGERDGQLQALARRFESHRDQYGRMADEATKSAERATDEEARCKAESAIHVFNVGARAYDGAAKVARNPAHELDGVPVLGPAPPSRTGPTTNLRWRPFGDANNHGTWVLHADGPGRDTVFVDLRFTGLVQITIDDGKDSKSALLSAEHWAAMRSLRRRDAGKADP